MRKIFAIVCFLLMYGAASGQLSQFRMIGSGSWSIVNDSTFSSTVTIQSDLTGNGFLPTGITDSMLIFSQTGQRYTISSAINLTFSSADLTIVESGGDWGTPVGQVMIYESNNRDAVPNIPFGSTGSTAKMQESVISYNSTIEDAISDGDKGEILVNGDNWILDNNIVDQGNLADDAVTNSKIASEAVTGDKIAENTVANNNLTATGVVAGSYTNANLTVNSAGRITAASNGSSGGGGGLSVLDTTFTINYTATTDSTINRLTSVTESNDIVVTLPTPSVSTVGISYTVNQVDRNNDGVGFTLVQVDGIDYDMYYSGDTLQFLAFTPDIDESISFQTIYLDGAYRWLGTLLSSQKTYELDTRIEILTGEYDAGERLIVKGFNGPGDGAQMEYFVFNDTISGIAIDTLAQVKTANDKYAIIRPTNGIITPQVFGAIANDTLPDHQAFNKMFRFLEQAPITDTRQTSYQPADNFNYINVLIPPGTYVIRDTVFTPQDFYNAPDDKNYPNLKIEGFGAVLYTDQDSIIQVFQGGKNGSDFSSLDRADYSMNIEGITFKVKKGVFGVTSIFLGAMDYSSITKCKFNFPDIAIWGANNYGNLIELCEIQQPVSRGIYCTTAENIWSGTNGCSAGNTETTIYKTRVVGGYFASAGATRAHYEFRGCSGIKMRDCITEGVRPLNNIIVNHAGNACMDNNVLENIYIENSTFTGAPVNNVNIYYPANAYSLELKNIDFHDSKQDTFLKIDSGNSGYISIEGFPYDNPSNIPAGKITYGGSASDFRGIDINLKSDASFTRENIQELFDSVFSPTPIFRVCISTINSRYCVGGTYTGGLQSSGQAPTNTTAITIGGNILFDQDFRGNIGIGEGVDSTGHKNRPELIAAKEGFILGEHIGYVGWSNNSYTGDYALPEWRVQQDTLTGMIKFYVQDAINPIFGVGGDSLLYAFNYGGGELVADSTGKTQSNYIPIFNTDSSIGEIHKDSLGGGGGSLSNFTESLDAGTQSTASFTPNASNTNASLTPTGTGALIGAIPDGTSTGGNARGNYAVDLQLSRTAANQVSSGSYSGILSGWQNQNSRSESVITGGRGNVISSGQFNSISGGFDNSITISGEYASIAGGRSNESVKQYTDIPGGNSAKAYMYGQTAKSSGDFSTAGDAQRSIVTLSNQLTGTSSIELFLNGTGASQRMILDGTNRAWKFIVEVVAVVDVVGAGTSSVGDLAAYSKAGAIKKIGSTTSLVGSISDVSSDLEDTNMTSGTITVTADDTNDSLKIEYTPPSTSASDTVIRVMATVYITEIGF